METQAQLQAVLDEALEKYAVGWKVVYLPPHVDHDAVAPANNNHKFLSDKTTMVLQIPTPATPSCLFIALHEVGHLAIDGYNKKKWPPGKGQEMPASCWAKSYMETHKVPVPKEIWQQALSNAKSQDDPDPFETLLARLLRLR